MNKFQFMGRLTRDPEQRTANTGTAISAFALAVNRRMPDKNGERLTDFFNITAFGKTADFCNKYFKKGNQVLIEGRIQNRSWDDPNTGVKRYMTDFIADQVYFADSKKDANGFGDNNMVSSNIQIPEESEYITVDDTSELPF